MKFSIACALGLAIFAFASSARADITCSDMIQAVVDQRAQTDFPGEDLVPVMPIIAEDGGSVESYDIPVEQVGSDIGSYTTVATYDVVVDEVCAVISITRE